MACFHCDCKRPPDEYLENKVQETQRGPRTRMEKTAVLHGDSNAWNFDFDDNESDGADVAAFEYADSSVIGEGSLGNQNFGRPKDSRVPRVHNEEYSDGDTVRPGRGFDDFNDEDDDIDNYELDTNKNSAQSGSIDFSEFEGSESEDIEGSDNSLHGRRRTKSSYNKPHKSTRQQAAFSVSDDGELVSDEELSAHPNWKSSHVADSRSRGRGRNTTGPSRGLSFGSDDELGLSSDVDDGDQTFGSRQGKLNKLGSGRRDFQRKGNFDVEDDSVSGSESDNDDFQSNKNRLRRPKENNFKGRGSHNFTRDTQFESSGMKGGRRNSFNNDFDRSARGSHGGNKGFRGNDFDSQRMSNRGGDKQSFKWGPRREGFGKSGGRNSFNDDFDRSAGGSRGNNKGFRGNDFDGQRRSNRGADAHNFKGPRREGFGKQQRGGINEYGRDKDRGFDDFRNSRRVIER